MLQEEERMEWTEDLSKAIVVVRPVVEGILLTIWDNMQEEPSMSETVYPFSSALDNSLTRNSVPTTPTQNKLISMPTAVSKKPGSKTPLVDTLLRRSPRINPAAVEGFQVVPIKAKEPAAKRRKKVTEKLDPDKKLPSDVSEVINPTSLHNIKAWATACGVAPEELSEEALMKGRDEDQE